jgi:hypothetical protein
LNDLLLRFQILFFFLTIFLASCEGKQENTPQNVLEKTTVQTVFQDQKNYVFEEELTAVSKQATKDWMGYAKLTRFLKEHYQSTSPQTALEMSENLYIIVGKVRDSFHVQELKNEGFDARLNVLNSEILRLTDMTEITAIKAEEVVEQTEKIIGVYNAVNAKINAIYARKSLDEEIYFDERIFDFRTPETGPERAKKSSRGKELQKRR